MKREFPTKVYTHYQIHSGLCKYTQTKSRTFIRESDALENRPHAPKQIFTTTIVVTNNGKQIDKNMGLKRQCQPPFR